MSEVKLRRAVQLQTGSLHLDVKVTEPYEGGTDHEVEIRNWNQPGAYQLTFTELQEVLNMAIAARDDLERIRGRT